MSKPKGESFEAETCENRGGVILGYWDHEKTQILIQDLEQSVGMIEGKCKKLLEELIYYKKCLKESKEISSKFANFKSRTDNSESLSLYGSEPAAAFGNNFINCQETREIFEDIFKRKLCSINNDLTEVGLKIGLKDNIVLFPTDDYLRNLNQEIEVEAEKSWSDVRDNFVRGYFFKPRSESDPVVSGRGREAEFSKITKKELDLYQELSRLSTIKRRKGKVRGATGASSKGRKNKLSDRWKICRLTSTPTDCKKPKRGRNKFKKRKSRVVTSGMSYSRSTVQSQGKLNESETDNTCKSWGQTPDGSEVKGGEEFESGLGKTRSSVQRSREVEQQHKSTQGRSAERFSAAESEGEEIREKSFSRRSILRIPSNTKSEIPEREGNGLWKRRGVLRRAEGRISPHLRKSQSGSAGNCIKGLEGLTKSTAGEYTNVQRYLERPRPKRAYAGNSKRLPPACQRNGAFEVDNNVGDSLGKASGDGSFGRGCDNLGEEWTKTYSSFLKIYRKYMSLKKTLTSSNLALDQEELKYLENGVDSSLNNCKKFLKFYKSLHVKTPPKPLKTEYEKPLSRASKPRSRGVAVSNFPLR